MNDEEVAALLDLAEQIQADYEAHGMNRRTARKASMQMARFRKATAGRTVTYLDPGEFLENPNGEPIGMTANTRYEQDYDEHGQPAAHRTEGAQQ